ncbi:MAG: hypothetical protein KF757_11275 [Phycisphaeraceae bacterium]|nr:hypothetical protein [Phycisphaeraceae bacterium]MCW5762267.1 hypothetical protein [Phycisphaeraceae bacterium]
MSVLFRKSESPFAVVEWQPEVMAMLDDHHLVAWSSKTYRRLQFSATLQQFFGVQRDTDVCVLHGRFINDLESFCHQLESLLPGPPLERRIGGTSGIASLLRSRHTFRGRPAARYRYFVWNDADVLLRHDHVLFGELADVMAGVAAECEFASDDLLLLQRAAFIGGPALDVYADDPRGQFQSWIVDQSGEAFWKIVTGLDAPPIARYAIDGLA